MRAVGPLGVALGLALSLAVPPAVGSLAYAADGDQPPSRQQVRDARQAAHDKARDVATVQAELAAANDRLEQSGVAAAQATEAWNGARYRLDQARQAAAAAADRAGIARADVNRQQQAYAGAVVESYEMAPALSAVSSIVQADGITSVVEQTTTMQATESALDTRYDGFRAAATLADVAVDQAETTEAEAKARQVEARQARDAAREAQQAAAAEAQAIARQKGQLIEELAGLQHVSVQLAEQRQAALEQQAAEEAAAKAQQEAEQQAAEEAAQQQSEQDATTQQPSGDSAGTGGGGQNGGGQSGGGQTGDDSDGGSDGSGQTQEPEPQQPPPPPTPPSPPAPSGGASAAVGFARAQLGEPYRWGAAGPDAWDCSGLTMGAWAAGGRSLPHYSVAQYEQSTPISPSSLRPGDLVFWGSSSSPSSIYHVAMYVGNGQIIHAPRTGRPVSQESMYYWITPNFYARP